MIFKNECTITLASRIPGDFQPIPEAEDPIPALLEFNLDIATSQRPRLPEFEHLQPGCELRLDKLIAHNERLGSAVYICSKPGNPTSGRIVAKLFARGFLQDTTELGPPAEQPIPWGDEDAMKKRFYSGTYDPPEFGIHSEMLAYHKARHLQGTVIPQYYGAHALGTPKSPKRNDNPALYVLLIEWLDAAVTARDFFGSIRHEDVSRVLDKILVAYVRLHACDIAHYDIAGRNALVLNENPPCIDIVLIDLAQSCSISKVTGRHKHAWLNIENFHRMVHDLHNAFAKSAMTDRDAVLEWQTKAMESGSLFLSKGTSVQLREGR